MEGERLATGRAECNPSMKGLIANFKALPTWAQWTWGVGLALLVLVLAIPAEEEEDDAGDKAADTAPSQPDPEPEAKATKPTLAACLRGDDIEVERRDSSTLRLTRDGSSARIKRFDTAGEAKAIAAGLESRFVEATTRVGRRLVLYDNDADEAIADTVEGCSGERSRPVKEPPPPPEPEPELPPEPDPPPPPEPEPEPAADCHPDYGGCLDPNASDYDCEGGTGDGPKYTGTVESKGADPFDLDRDGDGTACD